MRAIFDSHLDLAWNAVSFNRDLTVSVEEIRKREEGMNDEPGRGRNTLTLVELRKAMVPVCVALMRRRMRSWRITGCWRSRGMSG